MITHQIALALIEGPDSVVQLLYGNRHPARKFDVAVWDKPHSAFEEERNRVSSNIPRRLWIREVLEIEQVGKMLWRGKRLPWRGSTEVRRAWSNLQFEDAPFTGGLEKWGK